MNSRIKLVIAIGFFLRCAIFFITDLNQTEFYEYGEIAENLYAGKGYSLFYPGDDQLNFRSFEEADPQPSAYMPPAYVYFLFPFFLIKNFAVRAAAIIFVQIIISVITIYLMYSYASRFFGERYGLMAAAFSALNPEFIYSVKSITPTVIFHFLILLLFLLLYKFLAGKNLRTLLFASAITAALIFLRSETLLLAMFIWLYFFYKKEYKHVLAYIAVVVVLISPWVIRNYAVFDEAIPLTTNFGINLYRGNNEFGIGVWGTPQMINDVIISSKNKPLEIAMNNLYKKKAADFIFSQPKIAITNAFLKLFDLWIYNMHYERIKNYAAMFVYPFFFLFSLLGFIRFYAPHKFAFEICFFIASSISAMIFFTIPRYQTMLHIIMIPFFAAGIMFLYEKMGPKEKFTKKLHIKSDKIKAA
jgi:4-amino-4-deoxy-L-arabinose transferase-like glycosyltransferase